jgi:hypothetical protein
MQGAAPATMPNSEHPAPRTAVLKLIGLHSQHQQFLVVDLNVDYMHARNVEHRIGPGAPARTQTTPRVGHRRGFRLGSLVASDHEGPDTLNP